MEKVIYTTYNEVEIRDLLANILQPIIASEVQKAILVSTNTNILPPDTKEFLTRKDVCKLLNVSLPTVTELTKKGLLKAKIVGSTYRYSKIQINNYMNNTNRHR